MELGSKVVLLVEDDEMLRQVLGESLEDAGYSVATASDGQEALEWLSTAPANPQVIITDLLMPRMNGWELCSRLRAKSQWKAIPIFVVSTAVNDRPWPPGAMPAQQIRKPPDLNHLLHLLENLMSSPIAAAKCRRDGAEHLS